MNSSVQQQQERHPVLMAKHVTIGVGLCVFEAVFSIHVNPIVKYDAGLGLGFWLRQAY